MAQKVKEKIESLPNLPGQGIFNSEDHDTLDFKVSMYESDMPAVFDKKNVETAVVELVDEYVDCIETQYTRTLEKTNAQPVEFGITSIGKMYDRLNGKSDIVTGEKIGVFLSNNYRFKPSKRRVDGKKIRKIGTLGKANVYINPYVKSGEVYVIDRSVIDLRYDVTVPPHDGKRIDILVNSRTNPSNAVKYLFNI